MAIINISISDELLEKVNKYKKMVKKNRSEFFADAVDIYFNKIDEYAAFKRKKKAIEDLIEIGKDLYLEGVFKGHSLVDDIRRIRDERTDELFRRI
jgi:metal-responsive CopG/Arc/MetJ family transcriptional regulator